MRLIYLDDDRTFKKYVRTWWGDDVSDDDLYCGSGEEELFMAMIEEEENNHENTCFLLDVRMPVPKSLESQSSIWKKYNNGGRKEDVTGFAIAKYLIEKGVNEGHIRCVTSYYNIIIAHARSFGLKDESVWDRKKFCEKKLNDWKEELRTD